MVRGLASGSECSGFETACEPHFSQTPTVYPAVNGYPDPLRARKGHGGENEEWHPTSVRPVLVQVGSPTITSQHRLHLLFRFNKSPNWSPPPLCILMYLVANLAVQVIHLIFKAEASLDELNAFFTKPQSTVLIDYTTWILGISIQFLGADSFIYKDMI